MLVRCFYPVHTMDIEMYVFEGKKTLNLPLISFQGIMVKYCIVYNEHT